MEGEVEEASGRDTDGEGGGGKGSIFSLDIILMLLNTLLVLGALGTFVYTKLIYQRPAISEDIELEKKREELKSPAAVSAPSLVPFDQLVINIAMNEGKSHYATVVFALECRDDETADVVKAKRAEITDKVIAAFGKRQLNELNTIQGKLLLKTDLMHEINKLVPSAGVSGIYFSNFILQ